MSRVLVELCAGTAAVSLCALAGRMVQPLTGYMGGKRRWAERIVATLGFDAHRRPDRVVLVDAGPWGEVWSTLCRGRRPVVDALGALAEVYGDDARRAWPSLITQPPPVDVGVRVAHYLVLQARTPHCIPIWWDGQRWTAPTGSRTQAAHERGGRGERLPGPATMRVKPGNGLVRISTLAARVEALPDLSGVEAVHGDVRDVQPIPGASVYIDPPYVQAPRYAELLPRRDVLAVIGRWRSAGCRVVASESEQLAPGQTLAWRLPHPRGKSEVLSVWMGR